MAPPRSFSLQILALALYLPRQWQAQPLIHHYRGQGQHFPEKEGTKGNLFNDPSLAIERAPVGHQPEIKGKQTYLDGIVIDYEP